MDPAESENIEVVPNHAIDEEEGEKPTDLPEAPAPMTPFLASGSSSGSAPPPLLIASDLMTPHGSSLESVAPRRICCRHAESFFDSLAYHCYGPRAAACPGVAAPTNLNTIPTHPDRAPSPPYRHRMPAWSCQDLVLAAVSGYRASGAPSYK